MTWYETVVVLMSNLLAASALAFCGWVAKRLGEIQKTVSEQNRQISGILQWIRDKDRECRERLDWMRIISEKLDKGARERAEILGYLRGRNRND